MNHSAIVLRQQVLRSVGRNSKAFDRVEAVRQWLRGHGYKAEARSDYNLDDYGDLQKIERLILGSFCPSLL